MNLDHVEDIKWEYVGIYKKDLQKVYGKMRTVKCCPVCDEKEMHLYKNKGRLKIACHRCGYCRIDTKIDKSKTEINKVLVVKENGENKSKLDIME